MLKSVNAVNDAAVRTPEGCAGLSGFGPFGAQCRDCKHWGANRKRAPRATDNGRCNEYRRIKGFNGKAFSGDTPACRYFEGREGKWHGPVVSGHREPEQGKLPW